MGLNFLYENSSDFIFSSNIIRTYIHYITFHVVENILHFNSSEYFQVVATYIKMHADKLQFT